MEHVAFNVSRATFIQAPLVCASVASTSFSGTAASWTRSTCTIPTGSRSNWPCYKFEAPEGFREVDVLMKAHALRVQRDDHHITDEHLADALELLLETRPRLAVDEKVV